MSTVVLLIVLTGGLLAAAAALAGHLQRVYAGSPGRALVLARAVERSIYRALRVDPEHDMGWSRYAKAHAVVLPRLDARALRAAAPAGLPSAQPRGMKGVRPDLAFNTAVSFVTNTNWQSYSPELTMSYLTQMAGLAVQNFARQPSGWPSPSRSCAASVARRAGHRHLLGRSRAGHALRAGPALARPRRGADGPRRRADVRRAGEREDALRRDADDCAGPFASQEAIKELGTNGGGSYNANSAHPYENPTPFTNLLELFSLLLIPFAMPFLFGRMLGRMREGIAILAAMLLLLGTAYAISLASETRTTPALTDSRPDSAR